MPTSLASLRQAISDKFMFSPSDAAEVVISYVKDLGKKNNPNRARLLQFYFQ
jgi:hypothetical protein